jgi:hypothetical protein
MSGERWPRIGRAFRRAALPLASYYAVALALPLANGASRSGTFLGHALVVLVVPPALIILWSLARSALHPLARLARGRGP